MTSTDDIHKRRRDALRDGNIETMNELVREAAAEIDRRHNPTPDLYKNGTCPGIFDSGMCSGDTGHDGDHWIERIHPDPPDPGTIWLLVHDAYESSDLGPDEGGHAIRPIAAFTTEHAATQAATWTNAYRYDSRTRIIPIELHTIDAEL
jgi:hypothetical protein